MSRLEQTPGGVLQVNRRRRDFVAGLPEKESERVQLGMPEALENEATPLLAAQLFPTVRRVPCVNLFPADALRVARLPVP